MKAQLWLKTSLIIIIGLTISGCAKQTPSLLPSGFFESVSEKYPEHPGVKLAQLFQHSLYISENKEAHLVGSIEGGLLGDGSLYSGEILDFELHIFDTGETEMGIQQFHKLHLKGSLGKQLGDKILSFDGKLMLMYDMTTQEDYFFIDEFSLKKYGELLPLITIRSEFLKSQKQKRIKADDSKILGYIQSGSLLSRIDSNMINNRVMQGLDNTDIYASEGVTLQTEMQLTDTSEEISLDFLPENILIVLSKVGDMYSLGGDIGGEIYGGTLQGTAAISVSSRKAIITTESEVVIPAGANMNFTSRNTITSQSSVSHALEIPRRYIDIRKILPQSGESLE